MGEGVAGVTAARLSAVDAVSELAAAAAKIAAVLEEPTALMVQIEGARKKREHAIKALERAERRAALREERVCAIESALAEKGERWRDAVAAEAARMAPTLVRDVERREAAAAEITRAAAALLRAVGPVNNAANLAIQLHERLEGVARDAQQWQQRVRGHPQCIAHEDHASLAAFLSRVIQLGPLADALGEMVRDQMPYMVRPVDAPTSEGA